MPLEANWCSGWSAAGKSGKGRRKFGNEQCTRCNGFNGFKGVITMDKSGKQVFEFSLEGEILGLIVEDGCKLKYLRISSDRGVEYLVKL